MNQMNNMAGFNPGNPALGNMPMANGGNNAAARMAEDPVDDNTEHKLNAFIYSYLCNRGQYDAARALKNGTAKFDPPLENNDVNGDGKVQIDSKDGIELQRPEDLPNVNISNDGQGGPFLLSWFSLFWDIYFAQRNSPRASSSANMYVQHTQQQARMRQDQQQAIMQRMPMLPNGGMDPNFQQMMRFQNGMNPENLRQRAAMQNTNRNGMSASAQQMAQMRQQQLMQQAQQQAMRRDPDMEMNGQRPRTPSASDHAPSPSKRQRMDGVQFNGQPMMPNGRGPPPGMPGQMMGGPGVANANQLLEMNGINPGNLSDSQFQSFQQQNPQVQQKSIQVYAQNLAKNQRQQSMSNAAGNMEDQGSPSFQPGLDVGLGNEFYNGQNAAAMQMRGAAPPNGPNGGAGGNHALQDYQMQLMLLEQQNKKRLLMARQEQDTIGGNGRPNDGSGMPQGPFAPGMSPSGSRGGPSPGPGDRKGGTPKMNQVGLPGSPMPDGNMRSSPAAMNFNQMNPEVYAQMNGNGMRPPPSSHPGGYPNGQFNPQQMDSMARPNGRMQANGWQGPQGGQGPMMQQPQPQQPPQMGTPQQRNEMPPPQAVPGATANGRPSPPAVQPSPQPASKANPKGKKDTRDRKKPTKKGSTTGVAVTPASEAENAPPTPTPATPVTPQHQASFNPKNESQAQPNMMSGMALNGPDALAQPQPDPNTMPLGDFQATDEYMNGNFAGDMNGDLLESFDFEQFLQSTDDTGFTFDPASFDETNGIEASLGGP